MPPSLLTVIACSPILVGWLAAYACRLWARGRRRRQQASRQAQWTGIAQGLSDLDADLDATWTTEKERIRRYR